MRATPATTRIENSWCTSQTVAQAEIEVRAWPLALDAIEHLLAIDVHEHRLAVDAEWTAAPDDDVRRLAGLERAGLIVDAERPRRVDRQPLQGLIVGDLDPDSA